MTALDAAGITDPALRAAYGRCRELHRRHGRTYYLATRLLPPDRRPAVHALYGFARYADDLVDGAAVPDAAARLAALRRALLEDDVCPAGDRDAAAVVLALRDTMRRWPVRASLLGDFLDSMTADLTVTRYPTYGDLVGYMRGSAAAIGLIILPVLGTVGPAGDAAPYARDLGIAFQLTNFIRDVGEDLRRGRIYLPQADLRRFGVTPAALGGGPSDSVRALLTYEIGRARGVYRAARPGIDLLAAVSRPCVLAAFRLYAGILDEVQRGGYLVLGPRARVGRRRRLAVAVPAAAQALLARR